MKDRFAIFLDIDGTIYDGEKISEEDIDAISNARSQGHLVFINTGRSQATIPPLVKSLKVDGYVYALGTHIVVDGKDLVNVILDDDLVQKIVDYGNENDLLIQFQTEKESFFTNYDKNQERTIKKGEKVKERFPDERTHKFAMYGTFTEKDREFLSPYFDILQYKTYGEVAPKGFDKAKGIALIEERLGILHENTMAIGDSLNDLDMIEYAHYGIAMGNGDPRLKEKAFYVTDSIKNSGVSKAIEKFVLLKENENV